jgi:hypothetical protein
MDKQELQAMADGLAVNSFKSLTFRIERNLWAIDLDKVWKSYHYAVSKLNQKGN